MPILGLIPDDEAFRKTKALSATLEANIKKIQNVQDEAYTNAKVNEDNLQTCQGHLIRDVDDISKLKMSALHYLKVSRTEN